MTPDATGCPLCDGSSRRRFARHGFWIRDCDRCGHRFAEGATGTGHVARVYGDDYFRQGGAGYGDYLSHGRILRDSGLWYARLLRRQMPPGAVLEAGCAAGFWLAALAESGWQASGVEPNATMAEHARARGLSVCTGTLEELQTPERFDLVAMIQVVAHFTDPRRAVAAAVALLRPGGCLLVETWNRESRTARWLGPRWHEYSPPSVLHWFSPGGLAGLGRQHGLLEVARGRPRKRIAVAHAKSLLRYKYGGTGAGRLTLRVLGILPDGLSLPYPADDLFWMLLRKSPGPLLKK